MQNCSEKNLLNDQKTVKGEPRCCRTPLYYHSISLKTINFLTKKIKQHSVLSACLILLKSEESYQRRGFLMTPWSSHSMNPQPGKPVQPNQCTAQCPGSSWLVQLLIITPQHNHHLYFHCHTAAGCKYSPNPSKQINTSLPPLHTLPKWKCCRGVPTQWKV